MDSPTSQWQANKFYQSSILLTPSSVIRKIEGLLKKFIWEGGKGNEKKLDLVSWDKIKNLVRKGGFKFGVYPTKI